MRHRVQRKRKKCKQKRFHLFHYVIDRTSIPFLFYVNSLHCFKLLLLYYMLHLLSPDHFATLTGLQPYRYSHSHRYNHRQQKCPIKFAHTYALEEKHIFPTFVHIFNIQRLLIFQTYNNGEYCPIYIVYFLDYTEELCQCLFLKMPLLLNKSQLQAK